MTIAGFWRTVVDRLVAFDGRCLIAVITAGVAIACVLPLTKVIRVEWAAVRQTIDGFGAATNEAGFLEPLPDSVMDFFYTSNGIGLTLLRIRSYPSVSACEEDSGAGACVPSASGTVLASDLATARKAVARGATVWSSQWSPPGSMKTNGSFTKGGAMIGSSSNYTALAAMFATFVTLMRSNGVPIYALSPQNEPDMSKWYPSATWTPQQIHDFIPYLHNAFEAAAVTNTKIVIAEQSSWEPRLRLWRDSFSYAADAMKDASVAAQVGILAAHNYDYRDPSGPPSMPNFTAQRVWQTEVSTFENYDGSLTNALRWAQSIHAFLSTARVNAFHYWYLTAAPNKTDNEALTDLSGRVALRAYAIGNWSKFVRPGWHAVGVTNSSPLLVTAFQSDTGTQSAIVVVNNRSVPLTDQPFEVGTGMERSVTPWITSSASLLTPESPVTVTDGRFSCTIPGRSIVTFVGQRGSPAAVP